MKEEKNFLITGGNFTNKGAQSMLMISISEIKKRFPKSVINVLPLDDYRLYDKKNLKFNVLHNHQDLVKMDGKFYTTFKLFIKNIIRFLLHKECIFKGLITYKNIMKVTDCIIDISGFCLSSQFQIEYNMMIINTINEGIKYNIPVVLMPQSFGPFDYKNDKKNLMKKIKRALEYPYIIYARELDGYNLLKNELKLKNVKLSTDLVLQNKKINLEDIFHIIPKKYSIQIDGKGNVGFIPNSMNLTQGNPKIILELYRSVIKELLNHGKKVFIIYHSTTDKKYCEEIISTFKKNNNLVFIPCDLNCYEYDEIVKKFDFIVASRYHSIVHAYKNAIPCLILGWAIKYYSLAKLFNQEDLVLDTRFFIEHKVLCNKIENIVCKYNIYKSFIQSKLPEIQKENCFDILDSIFEKDWIDKND